MVAGLFVGLLGVAVALFAAGAGLSWFMTRRQGLTEIHTPADVGLAYEEVSFPAADGLALRGWWIPALGSEGECRECRAVVILHGHGGSMDWDVHRAPALHGAGFGVLLFDLRAHGRSEGRAVSFGFAEWQDVVGAVDWLHGRGVSRIGLLGFSLGGIVSTIGAARCPGVAAVVSDGGPARMRTAMAARGVEWGLPRGLARAGAWWTLVVTSLRWRANLFRYEPVRWVGRIAPRPILFIHGDRDPYCPDFDDLYAAAGEPKELWRDTEAGHTTLSQIWPAQHQRRVVDFFQRRL